MTDLTGFFLSDGFAKLEQCKGIINKLAALKSKYKENWAWWKANGHDSRTKGDVTLDNFSCNLSYNFVATQVT